jgi:hypothetical protein
MRNAQKDLGSWLVNWSGRTILELDEQALSELDVIHAEVRGRIEALGAVNQALEEYTEWSCGSPS